MIWSGTSPMIRARPPSQGIASEPRVDRGDAHRVLDPLRHDDRLDRADRTAAFEHELGHEGLEVAEHEDVGTAAR